MTATAAEASTRCQLADFGERVTNAIIERKRGEESGRRWERESSERAAAATNGS